MAIAIVAVLLQGVVVCLLWKLVSNHATENAKLAERLEKIAESNQRIYVGLQQLRGRPSE